MLFVCEWWALLKDTNSRIDFQRKSDDISHPLSPFLDRSRKENVTDCLCLF